jgi:Flp pilus assembly pilin Flp
MLNVKRVWTRFWREEDGLGTLEILLILAVLVVIAVVFRKWIISWVNDLFQSTEQELNKQIDRPVEPS